MIYKKEIELLKQNRLEKIFDVENLEEESNSICNKTCQWMKNNNGMTPNKRSKNKNEKIYGVWLAIRKNAFNGGNKGVFYKSDLRIAESFGYPDLFKNQNFEKESNEKVKKICEWKKTHDNKDPTQISKNIVEASLGRWLINRRMNYTGKRFYTSDQKIAESFGYPDLFKTRNCEKPSNEKCKKVCEWKRLHNDKDPSKKSKSSEEKLLGQWLSNHRQAYSGGHGHFYKSDLEIAKSFGYSNLFEIRNIEKESNGVCKKLCQWKELHDDRDPNKKAGGEEGYYGSWLCKHRHSNVYKSDLLIAKSFGYSKLFIPRNLEIESNKKCIKVCKWIKTHKGKYPNSESKNNEEASYGRWVGTRKKASLGRKETAFYLSDQRIAVSYGYKNLFVPGRQSRR